LCDLLLLDFEFGFCSFQFLPFAIQLNLGDIAHERGPSAGGSATSSVSLSGEARCPMASDS
jgi:hypothetical protein